MKGFVMALIALLAASGVAVLLVGASVGIDHAAFWAFLTVVLAYLLVGGLVWVMCAPVGFPFFRGVLGWPYYTWTAEGDD